MNRIGGSGPGDRLKSLRAVSNDLGRTSAQIETEQQIIHRSCPCTDSYAFGRALSVFAPPPSSPPEQLLITLRKRIVANPRRACRSSPVRFPATVATRLV